MVSRTSEPMAKYLYAVIDSPEETTYGALGIDGATVYSLGDGRLAAVVSDVRNETIRPERRKLAAHHSVLKTLMDKSTVLPMSFGIVADSASAIRRILVRNRDAFTERLGQLKNKSEMGVRVRWDVPNIFEYLLAIHPDLRAMRDQMFRGGREPAQDDRIELGRLFERILTDDRATHCQTVIDALRPCCVDFRENKPRNEYEVLSLACLVGRDRLDAFEHGVLEAAKHFDNNYAFDFSGPWPPHNFVHINVEV